jgi:hypothetical protein
VLNTPQTNLIKGGFDLALRNVAIEDRALRVRMLADDTRITALSGGGIAMLSLWAAHNDLETAKRPVK